MSSREEIFIYLKENLSEHRLHHVLMVEERARKLALFYGLDFYNCSIAGLLHDVLKETSPNNMLQYIEEGNIMYSESFKKCVGIWHGFAAAEFIKIKFGVVNQDIINAVRYHSTARVAMSNIEKVVFISDFTSCDRKTVLDMDESDFGSIDEYFFYILKANLNFLITNNRLVYLGTLDSYNFYLKKETSKNGDS